MTVTEFYKTFQIKTSRDLFDRWYAHDPHLLFESPCYDSIEEVNKYIEANMNYLLKLLR